MHIYIYIYFFLNEYFVLLCTIYIYFPYISSYLLNTLKTSLVAQMVKNLPAMQETQVQSLGWEDPLEKGMATHSSILAWTISGQRSLAG